jgi:hypothetical protein
VQVRSGYTRQRLTSGLCVTLLVAAQVASATVSANAGSGAATSAGGNAATKAHAALRRLESCLALTEPSDDAGKLARVCPDLAEAISELGLTPQLEPRWHEHLDAAALKSLVSEVRRYQSPAPSLSPTLDRLPAALRSLQSAAPVHLSWWQRLKSWLIGWLTPSTLSSDSPLLQLLSRLSLPRVLLRLLPYLIVAIFAAVLVTAVWLVVSELREAGLIVRRSKPRAPARGESVAVTAPGPLRFADLEQAPLSERCVLLVRLLVQELHQSGRLAHERTLTYRELTVQPVFDDADQRRSFAQLAQLAERQRYGVLSLQAEQWNALREQGNSLYAQWLAAPAARGGAA